MPNWETTSLYDNLQHLAGAMDSTPANVIRRVWASWQTPDAFTAVTFNQLLHTLKMDGNFWMLALLEKRLAEIAFNQLGSSTTVAATLTDIFNKLVDIFNEIASERVQVADLQTQFTSMNARIALMQADLATIRGWAPGSSH